MFSLFLAFLFSSAVMLYVLCIAKFIQNCFRETKRPRVEALRWVMRKSWIGLGLGLAVLLGSILAILLGLWTEEIGIWVGTAIGRGILFLIPGWFFLPRLVKFAKSETGRTHRIAYGGPVRSGHRGEFSGSASEASHRPRIS